MKECECLIEQRKTVLIQRMPDLYQTADLNTIQPIVDKHVKQVKVLEKIKEAPFASYLFLGNSGVGKSYIAWALWKNAAINGRQTPIINSTAELIKEYQDYAVDDDADRPKILPSDLTQSKFKYTVLLDEIDKFKVTEFSIERLFELIKNAVDYGHQLIVTANMPIAELKKAFSKFDPVWGSAIMRRLVEAAKVVEMWN